jgi:hypothetical protein
MLDSLFAMLNGLRHTTKKESVIVNLEMIMAGISKILIPILDEVINDPKNTNKISDSILNIIAQTGNIKHKDNVDIFKDIKETMITILNSKADIVDLIQNELSDYVTDNKPKAKDLAILRLVNDIGNMSLYLPDYIYILLMDVNNNDVPAVRIKEIRGQAGSFAEIYKAYSGNKLKTIIEDITKIGDVEIDPKASKSIMGIALSKAGKLVKLPIAHNFINNPIYHIRLWMVDSEIKQYETLKDKKRLIELRLMELKLKQNNNEDSAELRKQIQYYEDKIAAIEYKLAKIKDN